MRSSIILSSLLATLALAGPVDKRVLTTKVEIFTVWTTVTRGATATGLAGGSDGQEGVSSSAVQSVETSSSSEVIVPVSTPEAIPSSTPEAVPSSIAEVIPSPAAEEPKSPEPTPSSSEAAIPTPEPAPAPVTSETKNEVTSEEPAYSSPAPASSPVSSYAQKILEQHNIHRANHTDTGPLTWSDQLAATALKIANSCDYAHDTKTDKSLYAKGYGQNIGAGAPAEDVPAMITNGMYNGEISFYDGQYGKDNPDMTNFKLWGHFSQIVWRNTREVGCATVKCDVLQRTQPPVRPYFTVCNYAPPGNFGGQYTNVGTPLGKAVVTVK